MATENRGGFRPTAPQNQTGVSYNGGNGSKNGQPVRLAAGGAWGSRAASATQQAGATMKAEAPRATAPTITSLYAPTERPNEPITSGVDTGDGLGSSSLIMGKSSEKLSDILAKMLPYDTTGEIVILYQDARSRGN